MAQWPLQWRWIAPVRGSSFGLQRATAAQRKHARTQAWAWAGDFSATCWWFGRQLFDTLPEKVPIGLVQATQYPEYPEYAEYPVVESG